MLALGEPRDEEMHILRGANGRPIHSFDAFLDLVNDEFVRFEDFQRVFAQNLHDARTLVQRLIMDVAPAVPRREGECRRRHDHGSDQQYVEETNGAADRPAARLGKRCRSAGCVGRGGGKRARGEIAIQHRRRNP
jgi:hypothetical protein